MTDQERLLDILASAQKNTGPDAIARLKQPIRVAAGLEMKRPEILFAILTGFHPGS